MNKKKPHIYKSHEIEFKQDFKIKPSGSKCKVNPHIKHTTAYAKMDEFFGGPWKYDHLVEYRERGGSLYCFLTIKARDPQTGLEKTWQETGKDERSLASREPCKLNAKANALKRFVNLILGFGRYLYELPQIWVSCEVRKNTKTGKEYAVFDKQEAARLYEKYAAQWLAQHTAAEAPEKAQEQKKSFPAQKEPQEEKMEPEKPENGPGDDDLMSRIKKTEKDTWEVQGKTGFYQIRRHWNADGTFFLECACPHRDKSGKSTCWHNRKLCEGIQAGIFV